MNNYENNSYILSYNPDLEIYSRPETIINDGYSTPNVESEYKSNTLEEFEYNLPSMSIRQLLITKERVDRFIDNLKEELKGHEMSLEYIGSNDEEIKSEIAESNKNDIENGNSKLEVLVELEKISKELEEIFNKILICIYGKDVDVDDATEIDNAIVDKMTHYEYKGEFEKINYFSLYYDTQISAIIKEYCTRITEVVGDFIIIEDYANSVDLNDSNTKMFKDKFIKLNNLLDMDSFKNENSCEDILTAIHNIFVIKSRINIYMDTFSELFTYEDGQDVITEINHDSVAELEGALDNLVKAIMYSSLSKDDIRATISKKSQLRAFFVV